MSNRPIGLLDSGIGGLTVLKAVKHLLPHESFIYIGDSARNPYGNRTEKEIIKYTEELVNFLLLHDVKMIVIACNTATALTLTLLKEKLSIPVIGVISAGSREAARLSETGHIGVLATQSTVDSQFYSESIARERKAVEVTSLACPEFVDLVEANQHTGPDAEQVVAEKLAPLKIQTIDTLILGCTHFPLLSDYIQKVMGEEVKLIDSGALTAESIRDVLKEEQLEAEADHQSPMMKIFTTGDAELFRVIAAEWMENDSLEIAHISLEGLI